MAKIYKHTDAGGNVTYSSNPYNTTGQVVTFQTAEEKAAARKEAAEEKKEQEQYDEDMEELDDLKAKFEKQQACQDGLAEGHQARIDELAQRHDLAKDNLALANEAVDDAGSEFQALITDNDGLRQMGDDIQDTAGIVGGVAGFFVTWPVAIALGGAGLLNSALRPSGIVNASGAASTFATGTSTAATVADHVDDIGVVGKGLAKGLGGLGVVGDGLAFLSNPDQLSQAITYGTPEQLRKASEALQDYDRSIFEAFGASREELSTGLEALANKRELAEAAEAKLGAASKALKAEKSAQRADEQGSSSAAHTQCAIEP